MNTKFKLHIQGYGNKSSINKVGFKLQPGYFYLGLFASYSEFEIPVGSTINVLTDGAITFKTDLKIVAVNLGFKHEFIDYIPKGYKTFIQVEGSKSDIEKIKKILTRKSGWDGLPGYPQPPNTFIAT